MTLTGGIGGLWNYFYEIVVTHMVTYTKGFNIRYVIDLKTN